MNEQTSVRLFPTKREPVGLLPPSDGGGPHDPTVELRLTRLESDVAGLRADVSATRADTSYIRGRLESLPTTWQMIAAILGGNLALVGMIFTAMRLVGRLP